METQLARQIIEVTFRAAQSMRRGIRGKKGVQYDLGRYRILSLCLRGPATNRDLAEQQGVSYASMSRRIDSLVRQGLVERARDPKDRREVCLTVTAIGRKRHAEMTAYLESYMAQELDRLPPDALASLGKGLTVLTEVLE